MFAYGGILKLLGDLTALVGPISITQIVEYIQPNLSASLLVTAATAATASARNAKFPNAIDGANGTGSITHSNMTIAANDAIKSYGSNNNYNLPLSAAEYRMSSEPGHMMSALLINENTEIYYPSWSDFVENGWIMALLVLLSSLAQGSLSQASTHIVNLIGIRVRTSLQSLVYRKTLLISSSCLTSPKLYDGSRAQSNVNDNENSNGSTDANETYYTNNATDENNGVVTNENTIHATDDKTKVDSNETVNKSAQQVTDTGTITNLMSEDALNVMSFFWIAHYVWAIPLKVCIQLIQFGWFRESVRVCVYVVCRSTFLS